MSQFAITRLRLWESKIEIFRKIQALRAELVKINTALESLNVLEPEPAHAEKSGRFYGVTIKTAVLTLLNESDATLQRQYIVDELLRSGVQTKSKLFDRVVSVSFTELSRDGLISRVKQGYWIITDAGKANLAARPDNAANSELKRDAAGVQLAQMLIQTREQFPDLIGGKVPVDGEKQQ